MKLPLAILALNDAKPESKSSKDSGSAQKKMTKASVLYIHRMGTQYQCKDCVLFIPDRDNPRCFIHGTDVEIKPLATCGYFVKGKPFRGLTPQGSLSKLESGYTEESPVGYSCKRCEYFNASQEDCRKVDKDSPGDDPGKIVADACCSAWETK